MAPLTVQNSKEAFLVREKIIAENAKGSMVARRLLWLLGKTDLSNVRQVLDIGSWHLGQSIELAAVFPHARIDAFEPVPDSYRLCMQRWAQLNKHDQDRINVHNIALSNAAGEVPFYPIDTEATQVYDAGFSSMLKFNGGLNNTTDVQKEIKVQADTLDKWCAANNISAIDILWMDVQGAELLVMQGGAQILKNSKILLTEVGLKPYYEGHTLKADIDQLLLGLGFRELTNAFEMNIKDYEANVIYIKD